MVVLLWQHVEYYYLILLATVTAHLDIIMLKVQRIISVLLHVCNYKRTLFSYPVATLVGLLSFVRDPVIPLATTTHHKINAAKCL